MTMIPKVKSDIKTFVSNFNINDAKEPISEIRTRSGETKCRRIKSWSIR